MRTAPCNKATRSGRFRKAGQFLEAAGVVRTMSEGGADLNDACVTLCVHAGIASADVICCAVLGEHAQGENHDEGSRCSGRQPRRRPSTSRCCSG